ncbi:MAG TPA: hypothetical protein VGZ29_15320 [Terriglobia bacterium]|nr:hypothetical protein [Terriglobia bacterium]
MTPEIFAEWMRRQGRRVVRTESTYWHNQGWGAYQAFPYHWVIEPSEAELHQFVDDNRVLALRYSAPVNSGSGCVSYHAVRDDANYDLNSLSQWARKNVRRGLRNCSIELITFERLALEGWPLHRDTLDRQGRREPGLSEKAWQAKCLTAGELPGFQAWGALVQNKLAASVISFQMEDCCYLLDQQCERRHLGAHVSNALSFGVTRNLLTRPGVRSIFYALQSLDAPACMDEFKFRMGYRAKPVRQQVVFHPWLSPMTNHVSHALLRLALKLRPGQPVLSKAEGMLRFYLQGRLPAWRQIAPVSGMISPLNESVVSRPPQPQ